MKELVASGNKELLERVPTICRQMFPEATYKIVPHEGRPGFSLYGQANWNPACSKSWKDYGDEALGSTVRGIMAALEHPLGDFRCILCDKVLPIEVTTSCCKDKDNCFTRMQEKNRKK